MAPTNDWVDGTTMKVEEKSIYDGRRRCKIGGRFGRLAVAAFDAQYDGRVQFSL
jgi:hypothetical protein